VSRFLSPDWFAENTAAPRAGEAELTIQQRVMGGPDGDVAFVLRVWDTGVSIEQGSDPQPDVTLTEDYETALAIHEGRLSPAAALAAGRVQVSGAVARLLEHSAALDNARA
jgi:putative sterol carrier protein